LRFEKIFLVLGLGFLVGDVIMTASFCTFLAEVTWAPTEGAIFGSSIFFRNKAMIRLFKALDWLLAYLESKLWLENQNLDKKSSPYKK